MKLTPHQCPHTSYQVYDLCFYRRVVLLAAECGFGLRTTPADCGLLEDAAACIEVGKGKLLLLARNLSSERIAIAFTRRIETGGLVSFKGWV